MRSRTREDRDTIPRLQQLVPHMRDQLMGLRHGSTFEHARRRYADTVGRLDSQGLGRRTASRVGERDQYWAPTRNVLDEAMRLGFVERQQLPSSRRYVDAHRHRRYTLTELGFQVAEEAETGPAAFCDRLAVAIYDNHPYFRAFIETLKDGPIGCPEVTGRRSRGVSPLRREHRTLGGSRKPTNSPPDDLRRQKGSCPRSHRCRRATSIRTNAGAAPHEQADGRGPQRRLY